MTTPITTLANFKIFAGLSAAASPMDAFITALIPAVLGLMGDYCDRNFASASYIAYRDGNNSTKLQLANYPVTAVSSLSIDGFLAPAAVFPAPGGGLPTAGYFVPPLGRSIVLVSGGFATNNQGTMYSRFSCSNPRGIAISYTGGFGDASLPGPADAAPWPADLVLACHEWMNLILKKRNQVGSSSTGLAGQVTQNADAGAGAKASLAGMPPLTKLILNSYQNVVPEVDVDD